MRLRLGLFGLVVFAAGVFAAAPWLLIAGLVLVVGTATPWGADRSHHSLPSFETDRRRE